jgi:hypothetical protein
LQKELLDTVRKELGPVAVISEMNFVGMLPKTRSGKIMRRVLRSVTLGRTRGIVATEVAGLYQHSSFLTTWKERRTSGLLLSGAMVSLA